MKKLILLLLCLWSIQTKAQTHSSLWHKVDEIKRTIFTEAYYNVSEGNSKYGFISNQPLIRIDDGKEIFVNLVDYYILDQYQLNQIAGIDYWEANAQTSAIFGRANGVIEIFTHEYILQHPNVRLRFDISFENGQIGNKQKKGKK